MPPVRPLYPQKQTFEWQRPLFDPLLPLHPQQQTFLAVPSLTKIRAAGNAAKCLKRLVGVPGFEPGPHPEPDEGGGAAPDQAAAALTKASMFSGGVSAVISQPGASM